MSQEEQVKKEEIEPKKKSPKLEQIEKLIDKESAAVVQLLRRWMSSEDG